MSTPTPSDTAPHLASSRLISRDKADVLLLLVACVLVLLPHAAHLSLSVSAAVVVLLCWRGWITYAGHRLPPRWLLIPVASIAMGGIWLTYHTLIGRDAGVAMLTLLLALKLLEMHARRDFFVVLFLSYFVVLTNFFYSQAIGVAVVMAVAVVALLTAQVSFQFVLAAPPLRQRLRIGGTIFAMALPLMLVLFFLFPRINGPLWGMPGDANGARTGLSDTMSPGNISSLAQSDEIAFRAHFTGTPPPQGALYWRAAVLSHFDGRTWSQSAQTLLGRDQLQVQPDARTYHYAMTLEPHGKRWLFALDMPITLPRLGDSDVIVADDMQLLASQRISARTRYEVSSVARFWLDREHAPAETDDSRSLPPGSNPATAALAARLQQDASSPAEYVSAVLRYFHDQPFSYTLEPPPLGANSVDEFLLTTRAGFCEHYAAAFVVLMRDMQIPARVVTGYQGGEINPIDGYMEVRQSDAHAWAEVWLAQRGWVRVDPTAAVAPQRIEHSRLGHAPRPLLGGLMRFTPGAQNWFSGVRTGLDALSNSWNQWVLNYSPERQRSLFGRLGMGEFDWAKLTILMVVAGSVVLALTMLPMLLRRRQRDPVTALYERFCQRMARYGVARPAHIGPRDYSVLIAQHDGLTPTKKTAAAHFLAFYAKVQYGRVSGGRRSNMLAQLRSLLAACR